MSTLLRELEISKLASIKWDDSVTFTLPQLLQVYPLPQIVKIDKALSSKSDNSTLCKDTILCLHSNIPIQKVHGHLSSDKEKQISIPLDCRRKVEVRPWKLKDVYENVKELFSVFPKYVRVSKGYFCESSGEIILNFGDKLQLKGVDKSNKKKEKLVCFNQYGRKIELPKNCAAGFQPLIDGRELYITDALREFKLPLNMQFVEPENTHGDVRSDNAPPREPFQTICLERISNETVLTATSIHVDGIQDTMISPNVEMSLVICDETFKNSADYESILEMFKLPDTFPEDYEYPPEYSNFPLPAVTSAPQWPNTTNSSSFSQNIYEEFQECRRELNEGYEIPVDQLNLNDPENQPTVGVNLHFTAIPLPKIPAQEDLATKPVDNVYVPLPSESQPTAEDPSSIYTELDLTNKDNSSYETYEQLVANPGEVPKNAIKLPSLLKSKDSTLRKRGNLPEACKINQDSAIAPEEDIYQELAKYPLDLSDLRVADVNRLLKHLGMEKCVERFNKEMIDGKILADMDKENLQSLGVNPFHITKLLKFIRGWRPNTKEDSEC